MSMPSPTPLHDNPDASLADIEMTFRAAVAASFVIRGRAVQLVIGFRPGAPRSPRPAVRRQPGGVGGHTSCGAAEIGHRRNLDVLVERSVSGVQLTNQHEKNVSAFP
jgi:hypothetical protein